jgi:glycyl-tRNA synthetase
MSKTEDLLKKIVSHAKEYGYVFPSSEIYDGLGAVYDYGQLGVELKNNLKTYWWKSMVQLHENIVGIDSAIFMHPRIWEASGHVSGFNDPMLDNKDSKKRYRADQLIEEKIARYEKDGKIDKAQALQEDLDAAISNDNLVRLKEIIEEHAIVCPISGTKNWTEVRQFNLMFSTQMGAMAEDSNQVYLRPETAQGIFVNFLNVQKSGRMRIPFGIAQIGKAFRNEVIARQFILRMREFEQMELQFFVRPGTEMEWYEKWKESRLKWHLALGTDPAKFRFHDHVKPAHYANAAVDIEFDFPFGFREVEGIHSRTDFDLKQHQEFSGKKMQFFDNDLNEEGKPYGNYIPYVVETSIGLDRMFLTVLCNAFEEQDLSTEEKKDSRTVLHIPPALAPVKAAILPLTRKDGLPEKARELLGDLKFDFNIQYDDKDSIGKRYRRQDAIGTPICITVDHQSLEDSTVTIRHRDSMEQERVPAADLKNYLDDLVGWKTLLKKL